MGTELYSTDLVLVYVCIRAAELVRIIPGVAENWLRHDVAWWWPEHVFFWQVIKKFCVIFQAAEKYLICFF